MTKTLRYKDYQTSILYSVEDRLFHGKLLGIRDMVIFDGVDVPTLEVNFRGAVDEYLAFCGVTGKVPNMPPLNWSLSRTELP